MNFEIFGALVFWGLLWLCVPRASLVAFGTMWLNAAHPGWQHAVAEPITVITLLFGIFVGLVFDVAEHRGMLN